MVGFPAPTDIGPTAIKDDGTRRLLHDLGTVGLLQEERQTARERVEARLGSGLASVLYEVLSAEQVDQRHAQTLRRGSQKRAA